MKKRIQASAVILSALFTLSGCSSGLTSSLTPLTVWESSHTVFYAPQYAAMELGYFEEEGLAVQLETVDGDTAVKSSLASQPDSIGLSGPHISLLSCQEDSDAYPVLFSQIARRSGDFLVSAETVSSFQWDRLAGSSVTAGHLDDMSVLVLRYICKKHGIDPELEVAIQEAPDSSLSEASSGYLLASQPKAFQTASQKPDRAVSALGKVSGLVPCAAYSAGSRLLASEPDLLQGFANAVQKSLDYIDSHSPEEIASVIQPCFPDVDPSSLSAMIQEYKELDVWNDSSVFTEESFSLLQNLMEECGLLTDRLPYERLVCPEFAKKAG